LKESLRKRACASGRSLMKLRILAPLALVLWSGLASAGGGNFTGVVGFRQFDADQWEPTDTHGMLGGLIDFSYWDFPLHVELGLLGSGDSGNIGFGGDFAEVEQRVFNFSAGVLMIPDYGVVRPYFGGGLSTATLRAEIEDQDGRFRDDDSSAGVYIAGGVLWRLTPTFDLGIDGRYLGGTQMRIFGQDVDVDSYSLALRVGYGWDLYRPPPPPRR
jgi:hypothetical protein